MSMHAHRRFGQVSMKKLTQYDSFDLVPRLEVQSCNSSTHVQASTSLVHCLKLHHCKRLGLQPCWPQKFRGIE